MTTKKIAVAILNYNGLEVFKEYLRAAVEHSQADGCKVYIIDNCSTDASLDYVTANFPSVGIVRLERNHGYAGGYNRGLKGIEADYYVLLNSDVRVTAGWLQPVIEYMDTHPHVAACQPKILSDRNKSSFEYAGACGGYIDRYGFPFCRGRVFASIEDDRGQHDTNANVFWASGAAFFVRSKVFWQAGGFDDTFFAHMEEVDLCWRIKALGHGICCIPSSVVYHLGGATLDNGNPYKLYLNFRNSLYMLRKNLPGKGYRRVMAARLLLDCAAFAAFVLAFDFAKAKAVAKARIDYCKNKNKYRRNATLPIHEGLYRRSIAVAYYIFGRRTFDEIKKAWK